MLDSIPAVFQLLSRHNVPFVVIGGYAVIAHGFVRATEDFDVVFNRSAESEQRLLAALTEIHARWISNEKDAQGWEIQVPVNLSYVQGTRLMMLLTDEGFLDVFDYVPGLAVQVHELIENSIEVRGVRFVSKQHLLGMKRAAGRFKDLQDIEQLEQIA